MRDLNTKLPLFDVPSGLDAIREAGMKSLILKCLFVSKLYLFHLSMFLHTISVEMIQVYAQVHVESISLQFGGKKTFKTINAVGLHSFAPLYTPGAVLFKNVKHWTTYWSIGPFVVDLYCPFTL